MMFKTRHLTEYWVQPRTALLKSGLLYGQEITDHEASIRLQWHQKLPQNQEENKKGWQKLEHHSNISNQNVGHVILYCREYWDILHNQVFISEFPTWCHKYISVIGPVQWVLFSLVCIWVSSWNRQLVPCLKHRSPENPLLTLRLGLESKVEMCTEAKQVM